MSYSIPMHPTKPQTSSVFPKEKEQGWLSFIQSIHALPPFELGEKIEKYLRFSSLSLHRGTQAYHLVQDQMGTKYRLTYKTLPKSQTPWIHVAIESLLRSSLQATRLEEISYDIYLFLKEKKALDSNNQQLGTLAKRTLSLLYHLASLSPFERLAYLNHQEVDQTFQLFVRQFSAYAMNHLLHRSEEQTDKIKEKTAPFGIQEALAFCRQLRLEFNQWALFEESWRWVHNPEGQNTPSLLYTGKLQLPVPQQSCEWVLGINSTCCEWLKLEPISLNYPLASSFTTDLPPQELIPKLSAQELFEDWKKSILQRFSTISESTSYLCLDHLENYFRNLEQNTALLSNPLPLSPLDRHKSTFHSKIPLSGIFQLCWLEIARSFLSVFTLRKKSGSTHSDA